MSGYHILDLGVGTGALAHLLESLECEVWGVDFSAEMLSRAASRCPSAHLLQADLLETWPERLPGRFDCIVSAYETKILEEDQILRFMKHRFKIQDIQKEPEAYFDLTIHQPLNHPASGRNLL